MRFFLFSFLAIVAALWMASSPSEADVAGDFDFSEEDVFFDATHHETWPSPTQPNWEFLGCTRSYEDCHYRASQRGFVNYFARYNNLHRTCGYLNPYMCYGTNF